MEDKQDKIEKINSQIEKHKAALTKIKKVIPLIGCLLLFWIFVTPIYRVDNKIVSIVGITAMIGYVGIFVWAFSKSTLKIRKLKEQLNQLQ